MLHVFSMTSTLCALLENKIKLDDLRNATLYFGCRKEHVLRDDGLVPYEATWKNKNRIVGSSSKDGYSRSIDQVDEDKRPTVLAFIELVREADTKNKVQWGMSYYRVLETLPEDDLVMRSGEISKVSDAKNEFSRNT